MSRIGDIFWMLLGIGILIVVSASDELRFRYGIFGYIGAIACIGYGVKAIIDAQQERAVMKMDCLKSPEVERFYQNTKQAWMDDKLKSLGSVFKDEGKSASLKQMKKKYLPYEGSSLHAFFTTFHPGPDEYLVSISHGTENKDNAWFVLTNARLIQKDGETGDYREFDLKDIREYEINRQNAELNIKTKTGDTITINKVSYFPRKRYVDTLISG